MILLILALFYVSFVTFEFFFIFELKFFFDLKDENIYSFFFKQAFQIIVTLLQRYVAKIVKTIISSYP